MNSQIKNISRKLFAILLVSIVGLLTVNNALFVHFHHTPCGKLVVHAHPFTKGGTDNSSSNLPSESHKHSLQQFLFFDSLAILFLVGILLWATRRKQLVGILITLYQSQPIPSVSIPFTGRAPPSPYC